MALSGSSSTLKIPVIGCQFYFTWSATQSIENNTSTVTVIVYSARYSSGGWFTGVKNKNSYSVAGTASGVLTANGVPQGSTQYQWIEQSRWTTTVAHNSDGTKTGVVISARVYQTPSPTYDETISVTVNLDTIPRATEITAVSNITVSGTSPTSFAVTLSRKSSTFKHTITLKIGDSTVASWEAAQGADFTGAGTLSLNLDQRLNILEAIPNTMSAVMTLTVVTKNASGTTIGSKSKPATCNISTTVKPSIGSINISISTPSGAVSGKSRAYAVQNISTITAGHSATPGLGATLDARHVRIGQTVYTQAPYSGKPTTSGSVEVMIWLMDSRKQEASYTTTVSVVAYKQLSAQVQYLGRPLDSSSPQNRLSASLRLTVSPITYSSATTNAYRVTIAAVPVGGGSTITSVNETTNPGSASNTLKNYNPTTAHDETKSYTVTITVRDDYSLATIQGSLSTAAYPLVLGDIGVGVGKIPEGLAALEVGGDMLVDGSVLGNLNSTVGFSINMSPIYPQDTYFLAKGLSVSTETYTFPVQTNMNSPAVYLIITHQAGALSNHRSAYLLYTTVAGYAPLIIPLHPHSSTVVVSYTGGATTATLTRTTAGTYYLSIVRIM